VALSSGVSIDDGIAASEALDGIFWHSNLATSSAGIRMSVPSRKQPSSPLAMALRITPSLHCHSRASEATV
jgi:hypothetical protein